MLRVVGGFRVFRVFGVFAVFGVFWDVLGCFGFLALRGPWVIVLLSSSCIQNPL